MIITICRDSSCYSRIFPIQHLRPHTTSKSLLFSSHCHRRPLSTKPSSLSHPAPRPAFPVPRPHPRCPTPFHQRRQLHIPTFIMAPVVFTALTLTLYLYKSAMLILFQNKILYMPSMPPFSRSERIADYAALCKPVLWREERIRASDGTELALAVGEVNRQEQDNEEKGESRLDQKQATTEKRIHIVIIYFQGFVEIPLSLSLSPPIPPPTSPSHPSQQPQKRILPPPSPPLPLLPPQPPIPLPTPPKIPTHPPRALLPRLLDLAWPTIRTRHRPRRRRRARPRPPRLSLPRRPRDAHRAMGTKPRRRCGSHSRCSGYSCCPRRRACDRPGNRYEDPDDNDPCPNSRNAVHERKSDATGAVPAEMVTVPLSRPLSA